MLRAPALVALTLCAAILGCSKSTDSSPDAATTSERIDQNDLPFLKFGSVLAARSPEALDFTNPHHVARHAIFKCRQGRTEQLLAEMGHVEEDPDLGKAFITFLGEFGPDLEQFKDRDLHLKFHGYDLKEATSVWYYYLVTADGTLLEHKPWVSVHRSRTSGKCALTGIFLHDPELPESPMPDELVTSLNDRGNRRMSRDAHAP